ncbi:hypothetical protein SASPL_120587 [Salvia splendens]|uniref:Cyclin B n=1 Tax=Salvia splendens TaxID=180675 RepID=A0A8X8XUV9_SALSN|nr:hypothetical protein SASPL_120587 [Salvia splendens]
MTAERKNRRALGDIGNMVTIRDVNGKPLPQVSRPVTRSFCAQLLANAQAAAAAENNKCLAVNPNVVVDGAQAQPAKTLQKRAVAKPKPQEIIVISLDSKEDKPKAKAGEMSLKKRLAACGPKVDIDAADANNHLAVVEYIDEIYQFYKLLRYVYLFMQFACVVVECDIVNWDLCVQPEGMAGDYMDSQPEINAKMRAIMVDWLVQVHNKFDLSPETLYLTINLVDRYLASKKTQLVGLGAMLIASKYEEIWAPEVNELVFISDRTYSCADILAMEKKILGQLEWSLTVPTPYVFLARFIKASMTDAKVENMVYLLGELAMMNYSRAIRYSPSLIAASAVYAVRCTLSIAPAWNETGLLEEQLMECAKMLATFHSMLLDGNMRGIYRKYQGSDREAVALLPPPNSLLLP